MINKKKIVKVLFLVVLIVLIFDVNSVSAITTPTLVNKLYSALRRIKDYLVKLATPAAAVAIVSGALIRKLSFGDEERMVKGRKVIINAIIGYATVLCIDLIIKFMESLL